MLHLFSSEKGPVHRTASWALTFDCIGEREVGEGELSNSWRLSVGAEGVTAAYRCRANLRDATSFRNRISFDCRRRAGGGSGFRDEPENLRCNVLVHSKAHHGVKSDETGNGRLSMCADTGSLVGSVCVCDACPSAWPAVCGCYAVSDQLFQPVLYSKRRK